MALNTHAEFVKQIDAAKGAETDYPKRRRFCAMFDRRCDAPHSTAAETNELFVFEPSALSCTLPDTEFVCSDVFHAKSMQCLLGDVNTRTSPGLTLSFHVERVNQIRCYLWWDGAFVRLEPSDLQNLLPIWFELEWRSNAQFGKDAEITRRLSEVTLVDEHFRDFKRAWTLGK